jgi:hypothetical protein
VPDETARVPLERYKNPRPAEWPAADVVVGNPPFIGAKTHARRARRRLRRSPARRWQDVPESADFVMFWWHHAAQLVAQGQLSRFGFITTNSLTQTFNRRVVQARSMPACTWPSPFPTTLGGPTRRRRRRRTRRAHRDDDRTQRKDSCGFESRR